MAIDRANIRSRARIRADQDFSIFPTDAQYNLIADECSKTVFGDLVQAGYPIMETTVGINTTAFNEIYPIQAGALIHGVTGVFGTLGGQTYELKRLHRDQEATMNSIRANQCTHYMVRVDAISGDVGVSFFPAPFGGSYKVSYIPGWAGFANDATVWPYMARTDELVVLLMAAKGCRKEGEVQDAQALDREYKELWDKVLVSLTNIDMRNALVMRDVEGTRSFDSFDYFVDRY